MSTPDHISKPGGYRVTVIMVALFAVVMAGAWLLASGRPARGPMLIGQPVVRQYGIARLAGLQVNVQGRWQEIKPPQTHELEALPLMAVMQLQAMDQPDTQLVFARLRPLAHPALLPRQIVALLLQGLAEEDLLMIDEWQTQPSPDLQVTCLQVVSVQDESHILDRQAALIRNADGQVWLLTLRTPIVRSPQVRDHYLRQRLWFEQTLSTLHLAATPAQDAGDAKEAQP